jgi:hypothetical protein
MALITTPGAANADSYADLAAATARHTANGNSGWSGTDTDKEAALRRATAWVDATFRSRWPGSRVNGRSQALDWPRSNAYDAAGEMIASTSIPVEVVQATCDAALRELVSPGSLSPDVTAATAVRQETVGPLSVTYAGRTDVDAYKPFLTGVNGILCAILTAHSGWLLRA